ncbi:Fe-S cluster assembly protein SufD [Colwellia sp. C1TZA3]|uniref:Fe-S cluster assembly protein SufD n=1 Tax=Colwellia sp. C1TZA3 TaxID=2508879 RepID=UPI0011B970AB|nr:Fe-S cluster assembly protein SufD [Colwellia sp. C1TZA3]TWX73567.1 Fe-S cluster assembly protein SufD [Colwellia sp. C1TZA3]
MNNLNAITTDFTAKQQPDKNAWLQTIRDAASERLTSLQLPTKKTEDWKYLKLEKLLASEPIDTESIKDLEAKSVNDINQLLAQSLISSLDAYRLVFVNGVFVSELSQHNNNPYSVLFSEASAAQQELIVAHLDTSHNYYHDYFSSLNSEQFEDGLLIHIPMDCHVEKPFYIVNLTLGEQPKTHMMRVLVVAETGSNATIIEHEDAPLKHTGMVNTVIECFVNDQAKITHSRIQLDESVTSICSHRVQQGRDSIYQQHQISLGAKLKRNDLTVSLQGEHAKTDIRASFYARDQQTIDNHTCLEHIVPNCTSNEVFRGLVDNEANAVFNGRIHIHPDAQKTLAELSNKNLLLSDLATINTKPELEIYADDVRCSHGATVGQIDSEALFYLQSRGISKVEAKRLLSMAFIAEIVGQLTEKSVQEFVTQRLSSLFSSLQYEGEK